MFGRKKKDDEKALLLARRGSESNLSMYGTKTEKEQDTSGGDQKQHDRSVDGQQDQSLGNQNAAHENPEEDDDDENDMDYDEDQGGDRPPDPPPPEEDKTKKKKKRKDTVGDIVAADLEALASGAVGSDAKPELQNAVQLSKRTSKIDMDKVIDFQLMPVTRLPNAKSQMPRFSSLLLYSRVHDS
ncbi:hypothetical protein CAPTEDRAFT_189979 [Capitella teleta]|uniref:Uncharacterized protein n=1 Tax=Capitella teleta TaxID=283909 RepID=R7U538_CAPTE|nr:hypothetical protein CAPTEDRAFT_189979 [Capitella teleta]|eukprot:ELT98270.1 hypothetical protein CAPTEDRAFT_189979 [Capitella teleta]